MSNTVTITCSFMRFSFAMSEKLARSAGWCGAEFEPPTPRVPRRTPAMRSILLKYTPQQEPVETV
jgi:hypothetical protein